MLILKSAGVWLLILAPAMLNGIFREAVLLPSLNKPLAMALSGLLLSACIIIVAATFAPWLDLTNSKWSILVGCLWVSLTLVFEFDFGGECRASCGRKCWKPIRSRTGTSGPSC